MWETVPPATAAFLRQQGAMRRHRDGATLAQRGQALSAVLVVAEGRLRAVMRGIDGEEHLIRWIETGEAVGVGAVLSAVPMQADLVASGDCKVLWIPGADFIRAIRDNAEAGLAVARFLGSRLTEMLDHVAAQAYASVEDRVRSALVHLAVENGQPLGDGRIELRMTQEDLSRAVGASRQRVNEALKELERKGEIAMGYRRIVVTPARAP
ncbi:Crp/Fnr family transcriptional regulator [Ramlibacter tataouinensis]|uniref:Crp/Fnr family transcriptional regulator n=1 Tax=Ramlibacter tataouinensis TaxID=94132 RepID=UPI000777A33D|nr:Crp/Fnr family transcriptional regulator [Ramlibacter tataouinensis]